MAGPLAALAGRLSAFAGSPAGRGVGQFAVNYASATAAISISPLSREIQYASNAQFLNLVPEIQDLLKLWSTGRLSDNSLIWGAGQNGIDLRPNRPNDLICVMWERLKAMSLYQPSIEQAIGWRLQNKITPVGLDNLLKRNGIWPNADETSTWFDIIRQSFNPLPLDLLIALRQLGLITDEFYRKHFSEIGYSDRGQQDLIANGVWQLSTDVALQQNRLGKLSDVDLSKQLRLQGFTDGAIQDLYKQFTLPLSPLETILAGYRGAYTPAEVVTRIKANGIVDDKDIAAIQEANRPLPGPSDLIRFAMREVWDEDVVRAFGYDEEFSPAFQYWMEKQGFKGTEPAFTAGGRNFPAISWPLAYHRAGWQTMSPTQAYQALHRLRPNRVAEMQAQFPGLRPFTTTELNLILKTADYPKPVRQWLEAISYNVLTRVDTRRMLQMRIIGIPEAKEIYQDQGYSPIDATRLAEFESRTIEYNRLQRVFKLAAKRLENGYRVGVISRDDYARSLYLISPNVQFSAAEFSQLPVPQQIAVVNADVLVQTTIGQVDLMVQEQETIATVKAIRSAFIRWQFNEEQARDLLKRAGMIEDRIEESLRRWAMQRFLKHKAATASQVVLFVQQGIMPYQEAFLRLSTMGYDAITANRILHKANLGQAAAQAKAAKQMATTQKQAIDAQQALVKALEKEKKEAIKDLLKVGTPAHLLKWYILGIIPEITLRARLALTGVAPVDIDRVVIEGNKAIAEKQAKAAKVEPAVTNGQLE